MTAQLTIVDIEVKKFIMLCFLTNPSRKHALESMILSTEYEWVEQDGLFVLSDFSNDAIPATMKRMELDDSKPCFPGILDFKTGDLFYNHVVDFIEANIDLYCTKAFHATSLNLNPKKPHRISRGYNNLCRMPELDKIHPDWLNAIDELVSFELELYTPVGGVHGSLKNLDHITRYNYGLADAYKILLRAKEKIAEFKARQYEESGKPDPMKGKSVEEKYAESKVKELVTLERYKDILVAFQNSPDYGYDSMSECVKKVLKTEAKYVTAGRLDERFEKAAMEFLEGHGAVLFIKYNQPLTMIHQIMRELRISSYYEPQVASFINEYGYLGTLGI